MPARFPTQTQAQGAAASTPAQAAAPGGDVIQRLLNPQASPEQPLPELPSPPGSFGMMPSSLQTLAGLMLVSAGAPQLFPMAVQQVMQNAEEARREAQARYAIALDNARSDRSEVLARNAETRAANLRARERAEDVAVEEARRAEEKAAGAEGREQDRVLFDLRRKALENEIAKGRIELDAARKSGNISKVQHLQQVLELFEKQMELLGGGGGESPVKIAPVSFPEPLEVQQDARYVAKVQEAQAAGKVPDFGAITQEVTNAIFNERIEAARQANAGVSRVPLATGEQLTQFLKQFFPEDIEAFKEMGWALPEPENDDPGDPHAMFRGAVRAYNSPDPKAREGALEFIDLAAEKYFKEGRYPTLVDAENAVIEILRRGASEDEFNPEGTFPAALFPPFETKVEVPKAPPAAEKKKRPSAGKIARRLVGVP